MEIRIGNSSFVSNVYERYLREKPEFLKLWKIHPDNLNFLQFASQFFKIDTVQDISSDPNSNVNGKKITRLKAELPVPYLKLIVLHILYEKMVKMYGRKLADELISLILDGVLYFHDLAHLTPYCVGVDFYPLIEKGMPYGQLYSRPPKRPRTFLDQVKEAVTEISNEFAGAVAFPTLIILYTYLYLKYYGEEIDEYMIENDFQSLVHTLNKQLRSGVQSSFTNLSFFDRYILDEILTYVYPHLVSEVGGKEKFLNAVMKIQEIVMRYLCKGDPVTGSPYRFPVLTANLSVDENREIRDKEFLDLVAENNRRGVMNIYLCENLGKWSMCCRFQPEKGIEDFKFDSFGNGGVNIGSYRVITLNLNRIALEASLHEKKEKAFFGLLQNYMRKTKLILDAFRECLRDNIKKGLYTFFNLGWFDLDKMFYGTIGFIGLYEAMITLGRFIDDVYAVETLKLMDNEIKEYNKTGYKYNLEQVPGESASPLLPKFDKYLFGEQKVPYVLYSNQFVPLYEKHFVLDKIRIEGKLFKYLSGGGISHINILHELKPDEVKEMIKMCAKAGIDHFALNPVFSKCENNHYSLGKFETCPICRARIEDYMTRVVGFFTKVSDWNKERREWEFQRRVWFDLGKRKEFGN